MGFLDALFGRTRPVRSRPEQIFAIATAYVTLTVDLNLTASGKAGVCFRPLGSALFAQEQKELEQMLRVAAQEAGTKIEIKEDQYGFRWVTLQDPEFEDLVAGIHTVSLTLQDQGYRDQLLAADFLFYQGEQQVHWIYNFKRGAFYPFVPIGEGRQRDNAAELRLKSVMERELPIEADLERWYPLWGAPL